MKVFPTPQTRATDSRGTLSDFILSSRQKIHKFVFEQPQFENKSFTLQARDGRPFPPQTGSRKKGRGEERKKKKSPLIRTC